MIIDPILFRNNLFIRKENKAIKLIVINLRHLNCTPQLTYDISTAHHNSVGESAVIRGLVFNLLLYYAVYNCGFENS